MHVSLSPGSKIGGGGAWGALVSKPSRATGLLLRSSWYDRSSTIDFSATWKPFFEKNRALILNSSEQQVFSFRAYRRLLTTMLLSEDAEKGSDPIQAKADKGAMPSFEYHSHSSKNIDMLWGHFRLR